MGIASWRLGKGPNDVHSHQLHWVAGFHTFQGCAGLGSGALAGSAGAAVPTPVTDVIVVSWPVKPFLETSERLVGSQMPSQGTFMEVSEHLLPQCSWYDRLRSGGRALGASNRRLSTPPWTNSWSQICSRLRDGRITLPSSSMLGFLPASLPRRRGPSTRLTS